MTRNDERKSCKTLPDAASTYINKGEIKILQTLHKTLHSLCILLIFRTLCCVGFETKILHKSCTEPYMGTKSQRDKETKRGRVKETKRVREEVWERGRQRKTMGRERKTKGRERKTRGRLRKTRGRQSEI